MTAVGKRYTGNYRDENGVRRAAAARQPVVDLERAQPGGLAVAAVGDRRRAERARLAGAVPPAVPGRPPGPGRSAATATTPSCSARPRRSARRCAARATGCGRCRSCASSPASRPTARSTPAPTPRAASCDDFAKNGPLKATAFAHHPYTKKARPDEGADRARRDHDRQHRPRSASCWTPVSAQSGGKIPANLPIVLTEIGYESNPPDPRNGIPLAKQAHFNRSRSSSPTTTRASRRRRSSCCATAAPLKKYPSGSRLYWFTYQSGLYTLTGKAKPAAFAYAFPFVTFAAGASEDRLLGPAALPRQRPQGRRAGLLAREVRRQDDAVRQRRRRLAADRAAAGDDFRGYFTGSARRRDRAASTAPPTSIPPRGKITHQSLPRSADSPRQPAA